MKEELWIAVDQYITDTVVGSDAVLDAAVEASVKAGLPQIQVAPNQGKLLYLLARMLHSRRILEIGTLAGYSTIWLARALPPNGTLITLESEPHHAEVARANIELAGLASIVDVLVGPALETLPQIQGPFDLIFIDADKKNIPGYFDWSLKLARPGSVIVVDNVVREGAVLDAASDDPSVQGVRQFNELLRTDARVSATTLQTVGSKGYDGLTIALVS